MHTLTASDCAAIVIAASVILYVGFRALVLLSGQAIDALDEGSGVSTYAKGTLIAILVVLGILAGRFL